MLVQFRTLTLNALLVCLSLAGLLISVMGRSTAAKQPLIHDAFWTDVTVAEAENESLRLNLRLQQVDIRELLQVLADQRQMSVLISDEVAGTLSMSLVDVSAADAWSMILQAAGLDERQRRGVRYIAPASEIAEREETSLANAQTVQQLVPLQTAVIRVRYARAKELLGHLTNAKSMLSPRGEAMVDDRLNALIVNDVPERIHSVKALVKSLDAPLAQVAIEARIVIAGDTLNHQLGIQWRADFNAGSLGLDPEAAITDGSSLSAATALAAAGSASTLALGILRPGIEIDAALSLLAEQGQVRVLAKPKILTVDQSPAWIQSGVQIPYQETSRSGATSTSFREAVLSLHVLPQITPDHNIMMELKVKQDSVGRIFNGVPSINTNEMQTRVLVGNAETLVLGGILQEDANLAERKTPLLGDIPFLGGAFRRRITRQDQRELLVFITPTLVQGQLLSDSLPAPPPEPALSTLHDPSDPVADPLPERH